MMHAAAVRVLVRTARGRAIRRLPKLRAGGWASASASARTPLTLHLQRLRAIVCIRREVPQFRGSCRAAVCVAAPQERAAALV